MGEGGATIIGARTITFFFPPLGTPLRYKEWGRKGGGNQSRHLVWEEERDGRHDFLSAPSAGGGVRNMKETKKVSVWLEKGSENEPLWHNIETRIMSRDQTAFISTLFMTDKIGARRSPHSLTPREGQTVVYQGGSGGTIRNGFSQTDKSMQLPGSQSLCELLTLLQFGKFAQ